MQGKLGRDQQELNVDWASVVQGGLTNTRLVLASPVDGDGGTRTVNWPFQKWLAGVCLRPSFRTVEIGYMGLFLPGSRVWPCL
jgi:hypothetical protein